MSHEHAEHAAGVSHQADASASGGHRGHDHHAFESAEMVSFLELEAEVFAEFVERGAALVESACARDGVAVRRVIDLGSGPGVGTVRLAERFGAATVIAVDSSAAMLERVAARADVSGARVRTCQVDLNDDLTSLGTADVVWAAMSIHHVADEVATLAQVAALLVPGGVLGIVERGDPEAVTFEDDLGRPGIRDRLDHAWSRWFADSGARLPGATKADRYPTMLAAAGFEVLRHQKLEVSVRSPLSADARRFAALQLRRTCDLLTGYADAADLAALEAMLAHGPAEAVAWDGAQIRASRRFFLARPTTT